MTTRGGGRDLKVRVKTGKRSLSSKLWLERQLNDPYVARAKREGFRGRAAFKLIEIDDKHRLLKSGGRVVDLGAAPGGWSQVAAKRVDAEAGRGKIVAIDLLPMAALPGVEFIEAGLSGSARAGRDQGPARRPRCRAFGHGCERHRHHKTDHIKIVALAETAAEFAGEVLSPGGAFLCKVLQGGTETSLLAALKRDFATVKHVKPSASRADSAELYLLATGFRRPSSP